MKLVKNRQIFWIKNILNDKTLAVGYLVRGADEGWHKSVQDFLKSYLENDSGYPHNLYLIFKGFLCESDLIKAQDLFSVVKHKKLFFDDRSFDIGAYIRFANLVQEDLLFLFNTHSQILGNAWLYKFVRNFMQPGVGLVGSTGSRESLKIFSDLFPSFPNPHIRTNAFLVDRYFFCQSTAGINIESKMDAHLFESGFRSLTKQVFDCGMTALVVGKNGRGYSPENWHKSETFRLRRQENLLISDNQTRNFDSSNIVDRESMCSSAWGKK